MIDNVLHENQVIDSTEHKIVLSAQRGSYAALEALVKKHQPFIYNIVLRMTGSTFNAEDATQEILIKMITKLSTFKEQSSFRTWLYRIVSNHVLNMQRNQKEVLFSSFKQYRFIIDNVLDSPLNGSHNDDIEEQLLVNETKTQCMMGMLLCLSRKQRLAFMLGGILGASAAVGSDIMETTPENFRQLLSRARGDLKSFMSDKCSLMNPNGTCRCYRKTKSMILAEHIDPSSLQFSATYLQSIQDYVSLNLYKADEKIEMRQDILFLQHPFMPPPDYTQKLRNIIDQMKASWHTIE